MKASLSSLITSTIFLLLHSTLTTAHPQSRTPTDQQDDPPFEVKFFLSTSADKADTAAIKPMTLTLHSSTRYAVAGVTPLMEHMTIRRAWVTEGPEGLNCDIGTQPLSLGEGAFGKDKEFEGEVVGKFIACDVTPQETVVV